MFHSYHKGFMRNKSNQGSKIFAIPIQTHEHTHTKRKTFFMTMEMKSVWDG